MKKLISITLGLLMAASAFAVGPDDDAFEAAGTGTMTTAAPQLSQKRYVVTDYGVVADSTVLQTAKLQAIIDRAEEDGGGIIVVPKGTFLTGALFFKPGTRLHIEKGGVVKGSSDIADFPLIPSRMEGRSIYYHAAVINAYFVDNFSITGEGTVDGFGRKYWDEFWALRKIKPNCTNLEVRRPRLLFLWGCDGLKLQGVKFCNSAFWTCHIYQCNDVLIENCSFHAPVKPVKAPSSDAIDLDVCRNVTVRGCYFNVNDDSMCLKGGKGVFANRSSENGLVENVLVENCTFGPNNHGTLTLGSECIHARNIVVRNCRLENHCAVLRLKMRPDTYQIYEDITIENLEGNCGTIIDMKPWKQFFTLEGSNEKPYGIVRNIVIKNIKANCKNLGTIAGNPDDQVSDFVLKDLDLTCEKPSFDCVYPQVVLENVRVNGELVSNPAK